MHRRLLVLVSLAAVAFVGCTGRDSPASHESAVTVGSIADGGTQVVPSAGVTDTPVTSVDRPGTTADGGGTGTSVAAPTSSVLAPTEQPPSPVAGCRDAPVGPTVIEISFDDDTLRYDGAVAPPCVRVHVGQQLRVANAANFDSGVSVGAKGYALVRGTSVTTAVMGTFHGVGDVFDVRVNVLSASVLVQVLH